MNAKKGGNHNTTISITKAPSPGAELTRAPKPQESYTMACTGTSTCPQSAYQKQNSFAIAGIKEPS